MKLRIPYKVARALDLAICKDGARFGISHVGVTVGEAFTRVYATDGCWLLRLTLPPWTHRPGRYHVDGLALRALAKAAAGSMPHALRDLPLLEGDGGFPDAEQVIPSDAARDAAPAIGFKPRYLACVGKAHAELAKDASAKDASAFGIRRENTAGPASAGVVWRQGGALDPIRVEWGYTLTDFETEDGREYRDMSAVLVVMPCRLD